MDNTISFTVNQLIGFVTTVGGCIVVVEAVVLIVFKLISKVKAPEAEQNRRIKVLEEKVEALEKNNSDNDDRLGKVEEGIKSLIRGVQVLLNQSLGIKDAEAIKTASEDISKYLLNK